MKVLMISTDRRLFEPGTEVSRRFGEYANCFEKMEVIVFTTRRHGFRTAVELNEKVRLWPTNSQCKLAYLWDAWRLARRVGIGKWRSTDWISVQDPFETGLAGCLIRQSVPLRLQVQIHTDFLSPFFIKKSLLNWLRVKLSRFVLVQADRVRIVSEKIAASLRDKDWIEEDKIFVQPVFVDFSQVSNSASVSRLRARYSSFSTLILTAARLTPEKNLKMAIGAFQKIALECGEVALIIVGEGPERSALGRYAEGLGLESRVFFEPWTNDLSPWYQIADIFVLTSWYEGYGRTLAEALGAGLAIVSTDVGCAQEIIKNGQNGFVVPVGNTDLMAQSLLTILKNPSLKERMKADSLVVSRNFPTRDQYLARYCQSWE